jgi:uncharacterized protein (TIGR02145 family)
VRFDSESIRNAQLFIYPSDSFYNNIYGKLYNSYAVNNNNGLCPTGWRVPTLNDWNNLIVYLDSNALPNYNGLLSWNAGGKLKETGTIHWNSPNTGATNETGFTALPGGWRMGNSNNPSFTNIGHSGRWYSSEFTDGESYELFLDCDQSTVSTSIQDKNTGMSVRCIKE